MVVFPTQLCALARAVRVTFILKRRYLNFRIVVTTTPAVKAAVRRLSPGFGTAGDLASTRRQASGGATGGGKSHRAGKSLFLDNVLSTASHFYYILITPTVVTDHLEKRELECMFYNW